MMNLLIVDSKDDFIYKVFLDRDLICNVKNVFENAGFPLLSLFFKITLILCKGVDKDKIESLRQTIDKKLMEADIQFISFYYESEKLLYIINQKNLQDIRGDYILSDQVQKSRLKVNCGLSTSMEGVNTLQKLFVQAETALKESMFKGIRVCRYADIKNNSKVIVGIGDYIKLLDLFNRGMMEALYKMIEDIFLKLTCARPNVNDTVCILYNMLNYLYVNLLAIYNEIIDMEEVRILLTEANSIHVMRAIVCDTIETMYAKCIEANSKNYSNHIINYMINEVRTRYNTKITLYDIADKLAMNYNYLSGLFARKIGVTFQEYLLCFRLDKSKELLLGSGCRMNEIAVKCGFYDSKYYSRAFRKRFNKAPGEYRNQIV